MDENIRGVCSIEDTAVKMGNFTMNLADFENQNLETESTFNIIRRIFCSTIIAEEIFRKIIF